MRIKNSVLTPSVTRRHFIVWAGGALASARLFPAFAAGTDILPQPYFAGLNRALKALAKLGAPILATDAQELAALARQNDPAAEKVLNRYTLANLSLGADGSVHVAASGAQRTSVEQGWRMFLVRVANPSGREESVVVSAGWGTAGDMDHEGFPRQAQRADLLDTLNKGPMIEKMWLLSQLNETTPRVLYGSEIPTVALSGIPIEYRVIQLFSRNSGKRRGALWLSTLKSDDQHGGITGIGAYAKQDLDFDCLVSRTVALSVLDQDGRGCVASLTIKDKVDRVYPPQAMRLAPDMPFQEQVYRADGETVRLPDGEYTIESKRGPEYLRSIQTVAIDAGHNRIDVRLQRWIDPAKWGWYSGDTHIHPSGCAHYSVPTEGVSPETMIRHVRGEGLSVGDVLIWGGGYYYQRQFFTGNAESPAATLEHPELQAANNGTWQTRGTPKDPESLIRYDMEISGFPSSKCGHLVLLGLREQDYPDTKVIEDWPSWNLPILKWAKSQEAVAGYAHCGAGMVVDSTDLPNYEIPPFDTIGANEAIVDVMHGFADFLSACDGGPPVAELNVWYHLLNCGFRLAMVGETDWPCASDNRVGSGRSYVQLEHRPVDDAGYEAWIHGLKQGRLYCGDGHSHFLNCKVNGRPPIEPCINT